MVAFDSGKGWYSVKEVVGWGGNIVWGGGYYGRRGEGWLGGNRRRNNVQIGEMVFCVMAIALIAINHAISNIGAFRANRPV